MPLLRFQLSYWCLECQLKLATSPKCHLKVVPLRAEIGKTYLCSAMTQEWLNKC